MNKEKATIIVCTYNGEKYIEEQLLSLLNQTYDNIEIEVYDDLSSDNTIGIVKNVMRQYDQRNIIRLHERKINSGSAANNFKNAIIDCINKDALFFCDQDDVWKYNKVENIMRILEEEKNIPTLVCHDCNLIDEKGSIIGEYRVNSVDFYKLILNPSIIGCCMAINYAAICNINCDSLDFYMHDWYLSLLISFVGQIKITHTNLVHYRQHQNNVLGMKPIGKLMRLKKAINYADKIENYISALKQLNSISRQFNNAFLNDYRNYINEKNYTGIRQLFINKNVIDKGIHGQYQWHIIKKALHRMEEK